MFGNRVLRTIIEPAWDPVTGQQRLRSNPDSETSLSRRRGPDAEREGNPQICMGEHRGDGPRVDQGCGRSLTCVWALHP